MSLVDDDDVGEWNLIQLKHIFSIFSLIGQSPKNTIEMNFNYSMKFDLKINFIPVLSVSKRRHFVVSWCVFLVVEPKVQVHSLNQNYSSKKCKFRPFWKSFSHWLIVTVVGERWKKDLKIFQVVSGENKFTTSSRRSFQNNWVRKEMCTTMQWGRERREISWKTNQWTFTPF